MFTVGLLRFLSFKNNFETKGVALLDKYSSPGFKLG